MKAFLFDMPIPPQELAAISEAITAWGIGVEDVIQCAYIAAPDLALYGRITDSPVIELYEGVIGDYQDWNPMDLWVPLYNLFCSLTTYLSKIYIRDSNPWIIVGNIPILIVKLHNSSTFGLYLVSPYQNLDVFGTHAHFTVA